MIKTFKIFSLIFLFMFPLSTFAFDFMAVVKAIANVYNVNLDMKNLDMDSLNQLKNLDSSLTGTHHYGNNHYDNQAYEWNVDNWQEMLALTRSGRGSGEMAETVSRLARDFPMEETLNSSNQTENEYYKMQAQTTLATRAASQVAYQQAVRSEKKMQALHAEIDRAPDAKSAADLNNRLAAENAMTNVQQTKLLAVIAEQAAVTAQESVNRAKEDKAFFTTR